MSPAVTGAAADGRRSSATRVLVVGVGNTLRRDDGAGVAAAERMLADPRFADVQVRAAHQLLPEMALDVADCSLVVFVDADVRAAPGKITVRPLDEAAVSTAVEAGPDSSSLSHHVAAGELVALAQRLAARRPLAVAVGVGVVDLELGEGLSEAVDAALPAVLDSVARLIVEHRGSP